MPASSYSYEYSYTSQTSASSKSPEAAPVVEVPEEPTPVPASTPVETGPEFISSAQARLDSMLQAMLPSNVAKDSKSELPVWSQTHRVKCSRTPSLDSKSGLPVWSQTHRVKCSRTANVSPSHLDILIDKLLAPGAQMGQLSYGYEMLHKDSRRTLGILFRLWLAMRNKNPIKIEWQAQMFQTGFGIEMLPAFGEAVCKRAKITMGEDGAKKVKEVIDKFQDDAEWQAMMKLAVPVDNHFKEVVHADSKQCMLPAHLHEQVKMTSEEFKTILKACPIKIQKCYERTKDTVWDQIWNPPNFETIEINESPELFTQCMLEVYQCLEIFNLTSSYSKAHDFRMAKCARDYKLKMFAILKDNFKEEHENYEAFVKVAKSTDHGREQLKEIWGSLGAMGQNVFQKEHAELYEEPEKKPQEQ